MPNIFSDVGLYPGDCPNPYATKLKLGDSGPCVLYAKARLVIHKYLTLEALYSDVFDRKTRVAIEQFQRDRKLLQTGIIDGNTWYYLLQPPKIQPEPQPSECKPPYPTLYRGSQGACVKLAQQRLQIHGFNPGPIDGMFGPQTEAAVKSFQRAKGLSVDGVIGSKTWSALMQQPSVAPSPTPSPPPVEEKPPTTTKVEWPLVAVGMIGLTIIALIIANRT